jgi:hypothetical protein
MSPVSFGCRFVGTHRFTKVVRAGNSYHPSDFGHQLAREGACRAEYRAHAFVFRLYASAKRTAAASSGELWLGTNSLGSRSSACSRPTARATARTSLPLPVETRRSTIFGTSRIRPHERQSRAPRRSCCANGLTDIPSATQPNVKSFSISTCTSTIITACTQHSLTNHPSLG